MAAWRLQAISHGFSENAARRARRPGNGARVGRTSNGIHDAEPMTGLQHQPPPVVPGHRRASRPPWLPGRLHRPHCRRTSPRPYRRYRGHQCTPVGTTPRRLNRLPAPSSDTRARSAPWSSCSSASPPHRTSAVRQPTPGRPRYACPQSAPGLPPARRFQPGNQYSHAAPRDNRVRRI